MLPIAKSTETENISLVLWKHHVNFLSVSSYGGMSTNNDNYYYIITTVKHTI